MSCKGSPANPTTKSSSLKGCCTFSCGSGTFLTVDMSVSPAAAGALRTVTSHWPCFRHQAQSCTQKGHRCSLNRVFGSLG